MFRFLVAFALLLPTVALVSCGQSTTEKSVESGNESLKRVDELSKQLREKLNANQINEMNVRELNETKVILTEMVSKINHALQIIDSDKNVSYQGNRAGLEMKRDSAKYLITMVDERLEKLRR